MDMIFKALGDPARRAILDSLRARDGQTLSALEPQLDMTRFGVMKHLAVLEEAGLITTKKVGRFKHHYLNAVPLQQAIDRWIEPLLAKPMAQGLNALKTQLEQETDMLDTMVKPDFVHQTLIRCTQDALWAALTRADMLGVHHFAVDDVRDVDGGLNGYRADGTLMLREVNTHVVPKTRIERSFQPFWYDGDTRTSRTVFIIAPEGDACLLTCEHYDLPKGQAGVTEGWARFCASMKSWLETGAPLKMGPLAADVGA